MEVQIKISKAAQSIPVDIDKLPQEIFNLAVMEGLQVLLNAKMSKITTAKLEGEALASARAAALAKAQENLAELYDGKATKRARAAAKADGVSREVMTEAMRLARAIVKDELRANNIRPSLVAASEITAAAKQVIEATPSIIEQARANLEGRTHIKPSVTLALKEDPKLVKAADEKKAAAKAERQLSAKQAGKVAPRRSAPKPGKESHAAQ